MVFCHSELLNVDWHCSATESEAYKRHIETAALQCAHGSEFFAMLAMQKPVRKWSRHAALIFLTWGSF